MFFTERLYRRFNYQGPIIFLQKGHGSWDYGITKDISEGGFFILTSSLPQKGDLVDLRLINLLGGTMIHFSGKVARVQEKTPRGSGIGVELVNPGVSSELKRLCDYLGQNISPDTRGSVMVSGTFSHVKATTLARTLLENVSFMNYYQIVGVTFSVLPEELDRLQVAMLSDLNLPVEMLQVGDRQLLADALELVHRVMGILRNPQRRLLYDISQGEVDPAIVLRFFREQAIDLAVLQDAWRKKFPDKAARAATLWAESSATNQIGQADLAREMAKQAARLDPFNPIYLK